MIVVACHGDCLLECVVLFSVFYDERKQRSDRSNRASFALLTVLDKRRGHNFHHGRFLVAFDTTAPLLSASVFWSRKIFCAQNESLVNSVRFDVTDVRLVTGEQQKDILRESELHQLGMQ